MSDVDRYFGTPPGPDGYIVICTRWPDTDEWDEEMMRRGPRGCDDAPLVPAPDWHGTPAWTRDHFERFHGWDEQAVRRFQATKGRIRDAHLMEHTELDECGETTMPIPHTHLDGAQYAIAHSDYRYEEDRRAILTLWQSLRAR